MFRLRRQKKAARKAPKSGIYSRNKHEIFIVNSNHENLTAKGKERNNGEEGRRKFLKAFPPYQRNRFCLSAIPSDAHTRTPRLGIEKLFVSSPRRPFPARETFSEKPTLRVFVGASVLVGNGFVGVRPFSMCCEGGESARG